MPTADDLDPIQDSKRFYESLMADADAAPVALPPIPTERLDETEAFRLANRRAQRLHMAFDLFRSLVSGAWSKAIGPGNSTGKIRAWCWDQADAFLAEGDRPPASAAAVKRSEDDIGPTDFRLKYLEWLAAPHRGGSCDENERPPNMLASMAEAVRARLLAGGLITATYASGVAGSVPGVRTVTRYTITDAGRAVLEPIDESDLPAQRVA